MKTIDNVLMEDLRRMQDWDYAQKKTTSLLQIQAWIDHWEMCGQSVYLCISSSVKGPYTDDEKVLISLCKTLKPDIHMISEKSFSSIDARHFVEDSARYRPILPGLCYRNKALTATWLQESCADTDAPHPSSRPLSFWMPWDIKKYLEENPWSSDP